MTVKAWLAGVPDDLELLADLFAEGDVRVERDGEEYFLTAPDIDNPPPETTYYNSAQHRLSQLNGLARLEDPHFRPVTLTGKYTDGDRIHQVISPTSARCTLRAGRPTVIVTNADGTVVPNPPSPWPHRIKQAASHPAIGRVLRITARNDELDWYDLYKIHEIIRHNIEPRKLDALGWTTKARDRAFTGSADRYDVSGDAARHAVDRHSEPPKQTMTIAEGRDYISGLVKHWMDWLRDCP